MSMFNLCTNSTQGSTAVTGFALGYGYAFGTIGPLLGGLLSSLSGGWRLPLIVFALTAIPMVPGRNSADPRPQVRGASFTLTRSRP
jgi:CP family cyanate transporter-like MFS transporter